MTTWQEIKEITLQKLFITGGGSDAQEYIEKMPAVYNEAARLISTHDRYVQKMYVTECDGLTDAMVINIYEDIPDSYQIQRIYYRKDGTWQEVRPIEVVANQFIVLDGNLIGEYVVSYFAYPMKVTNLTEDETVLDIDDDVASIIPLYMASQLYKEDDNSIATVYRNEFEAARGELRSSRNGSLTDKFVCTTGWWS